MVLQNDNLTQIIVISNKSIKFQYYLKLISFSIREKRMIVINF